MSGKTTGKVWDLELSPPKQIVLLAMADHADHEDGNIYPSVGLIAWKTGYSDRQVRRIMKELELEGLLVPTEKPNGKPINYRIDFSKGKPKPDYVPVKVHHGVRSRIKPEGQDVIPDEDKMSYHDKMSGLTSHESERTPGYDIASLKKTRNVKDQPSLKEQSKSRAVSKPKTQYGFVVDFSLVEQGGGLLQYADGIALVNGDRAALAQAALKIFTAYLETLRSLNRAPTGQDESLWEKHQEAALNLALARTDPEIVERYIIDQYQGDDPFWRQKPITMKLSHIAEHIAAWAESRTASVRGAGLKPAPAPYVAPVVTTPAAQVSPDEFKAARERSLQESS